MSLFKNFTAVFLLLFLFTAFSGVSINESGFIFEPNIVQAAESSGKALGQPTWQVEQNENSVITLLNLFGVTIQGVTYLLAAVVGLVTFLGALYGIKQMADANSKVTGKMVLMGILAGCMLTNLTASLDLFVEDGFNCTRESFINGTCGNKESSGVVGDLLKRIETSAGSSSFVQQMDELKSVIGAASYVLRSIGFWFAAIAIYNFKRIADGSQDRGMVDTNGKAFWQLVASLTLWFHPFIILGVINIFENLKIIGG